MKLIDNKKNKNSRNILNYSVQENSTSTFNQESSILKEKNILDYNDTLF